ncbi:cyclic lactone autoinducer peptide [Paenibacillus humicus]|nr:cyclic lactone autoinducer peptide [Paenibacillus humicus]
MKNKAYKLLALVMGGIAVIFATTGSYTIFYKPEIPAELRKKENA